MKIAMRICFLCILLMILATSANGEIKGRTLSVSPFIGGYTFEGNEDLETKPLLGIRFGYNITNRYEIESVFTYLSTNFERQGVVSDVNVYGYRLEALYHLLDKGRFACSLAAGLGGRSLDYTDVDVGRNQFLVDYGLALQYFLSDNLALRGDLRHLVLFNDTFNNLEYTLGLTYYFGSPKSQPPPVAVAIADADKDGVPDSTDVCPKEAGPADRS